MMRDRQLLPNDESATDGVVMYESNFGLHRQPFQCADLSRAFYVSESIRSVLPQLLHAMRSDLGIAVLTGPAGVGKTSLLKHLQGQLKHEGRVITCSGASLETPNEILQTLLKASQLRAGELSADLSATSMACTRWAVVEQMRKTTEFWGPILLLVDDAHLMSVPVFNELRAFTEEDWNGRSLMRLLIAGPLSLEEELARPSQLDFSRRVRCHAFLQPLTSRESIAFLNRHLEVVGGKLNNVFSPEAVELMCAASDGLPRCISLLADESLIVALQQNRKQADQECVRIALGRLQHLAYPWNASPLAAETSIERTGDVGSSHHQARTSVEQKSDVTVRGISAGVIEIGSPGVIEIGSGVTHSAALPSGTLHTSEVSAERTGPTSPAESVRNHSFEVGHRYSPDTLETADAVEMDSFDVRDADSFNNIGAGTMMEHEADELQEEFDLENISVDDDTAEPNVAEYAQQLKSIAASGLTGGNSQIPPHPAAELSSRVPVFDRYTWISLGREVPSGTYAVSSALDMQRVTGSPGSQSLSVLSLTDSAATSTTFDRIPILDVSDTEISQWLLSRTTPVAHGTFHVVNSDLNASHTDEDFFTDPLMAAESSNSQSAPYVGVELFNPADEEPAADVTSQLSATKTGLAEFSEADRQFIQNAIRSTLSKYLPVTATTAHQDSSGEAMAPASAADTIEDQDQPSVWNDGQLLFNSSSGTEALREAISERVFHQLSDAAAEGDHISFSFEAARAARDEQIIADQTSASSEQPADKFFSLPNTPKTLEWDLRSGLLACEEIAPLADSLASLRDEVTSFQQMGQMEAGRLSSDGFGDPISGGLSHAGESLVSRAKRRLDNESEDSLVRATGERPEVAGMTIDRRANVPPETGAPEPVREILAHQAEQMSPAAQNQGVSTGPSFTRLFTKLRKMRAQTTEN